MESLPFPLPDDNNFDCNILCYRLIVLLILIFNFSTTAKMFVHVNIIIFNYLNDKMQLIIQS